MRKVKWSLKRKIRNMELDIKTVKYLIHVCEQNEPGNLVHIEVFGEKLRVPAVVAIESLETMVNELQKEMDALKKEFRLLEDE